MAEIETPTPVASTKSYLKLVELASLTNWSVRFALETTFNYNPTYPLRRLSSFLQRNKTEVIIEDEVEYRRVTIRMNNRGVLLRDVEIGKNIGTKRQFRLAAGHFVLSKIDARNGALGIAPPELDGATITADFLAFDVNTELINPYFLALITSTSEFIRFCQSCSSGTTNRQRLDENLFLNVQIPLPTLEEQSDLVAAHQNRIQVALSKRDEAAAADSIAATALLTELGLKAHGPKQRRKGLYFVESKDVREWGIDKIGNSINYQSSKWHSATLDTQPELSSIVFRGKSPVYAASDVFMLNQKCIRWNSIEVKHAKTVSADWLAGIDSIFLTQEDDVLINSTGEGTIGRAAVVTQATVGYLVDTHVLVARLDTTKINAYLWTEIINSPHGQQQINEIKSAQTTKQTELGTANLKRIVFPLPPLAKQNELADLLRQTKEQALRLREDAKALESEAVAAFEAAIFQ